MNEEKMCETELTSTCEQHKTDSCATPVTFNADIGAHVGKQVKFLFLPFFFFSF